MKDSSIKRELSHLVITQPGDGHDINEQAFLAKLEAMPLLNKVQKALRKAPVIPFVSFAHAVSELTQKGELTSAEADILLAYDDKRKLAVRVDEYTFDLELIDATQESHKVAVDAA